MKKGVFKITALCMSTGLVLSQGSAAVLAAGTDTVLAGLNDLSAANADNAGEETAAASDTTDDTVTTEEVMEEETEAAFTPDLDAKGTTGFAVCEEYLNVRSDADKESDVVGKVYNFGALEIVDVDEYGWYKVRSGNVEGYVAGQYVATGALAEEIAADAGFTTAEIGAEVLNVRSSASTDADIVATVTEDQEIEVVEDGGDWVKVVVDGTYGYVSSDYVYTSTSYSTAETLEEEQQRLDDQWIAYLNEQAAASYDAGSYDYSYSEPVYQTYTASAPSQDTYQHEAAVQSYYETYAEDAALAESAQAEADLQYQLYLDAQAAAQEAQSYDDEQAVYEAAAAAQEAYQQYADAQAAADEAAYTADASAQSYEEAASQEYYEDTAAQDTYYDDGSYEESYYEASSAQDEADLQYQAYLEAQEAADAAAQTSGDEQEVYDTAIAAQEAYQQYVEAQEAADAAAVDAQYTSYEETSYEETYEEPSYQEDTYTESYESYEESYEDTSSSSSSLGQQIANFACQYVGGPYVYGGSSLTGGADCSGFTMAVYANFGISLPHNAAAQSGCGTSVSLDSLQPGDLLFYSDGSGIGHVTMYIGGGQVVHASNPTNGIIISDIGYRTPCSAIRLV